MISSLKIIGNNAMWFRTRKLKLMINLIRSLTRRRMHAVASSVTTATEVAKIAL